MERNVRLIPLHQAVAHTLAWMPVFVLFTRGHHGVDGALTLAAVYYFATVVLEVPSGWCSDRFGRVVTLRLAAIAWVGAHSAFLLANESFAAVVIGQVAMALGFSSLSGTDVALHYDSLEAIDRADEYERRQSRAVAFGYLAGTAGTLAGGALGLIDLRLAFAASLVLAVVQLAMTFWLSEPPTAEQAPSLVPQLKACGQLILRPLLAWLFVYWVAMVVLEHVAFTLSQPYLTEALGRDPEDLGATPLVAGIQFAIASGVGAAAAASAPRLRERFGLVPALVGLAAVSAVIVTVMASIVHVAVIALLLFRSLQGAAAPVLLTAAASPHVPTRQRATYFSIHSLAGRLTYSGVLFVVAATAGDDLRRSLMTLAGIAWCGIAVVLVGYRLLGRPVREAEHAAAGQPRT